MKCKKISGSFPQMMPLANAQDYSGSGMGAIVLGKRLKEVVIYFSSVSSMHHPNGFQMVRRRWAQQTIFPIPAEASRKA
jgi:aldehyde:ferredoxin oxidoreductase